MPSQGVSLGVLAWWGVSLGTVVVVVPTTTPVPGWVCVQYNHQYWCSTPTVYHPSSGGCIYTLGTGGSTPRYPVGWGTRSTGTQGGGAYTLGTGVYTPPGTQGWLLVPLMGPTGCVGLARTLGGPWLGWLAGWAVCGGLVYVEP